MQVADVVIAFVARIPHLAASLLIGAALVGSVAAQSWASLTPAEAGFDPGKLAALRRDLADRGTSALIVVRRGKIVLEWYAPGNGPEKPQGTASLAKALVGGLSLLAAMNDGRISSDDLASKYIASWKDDSRKARITIRELATHTSGIEDAEVADLPHEKLAGWKGAFWRRDPNPISIALHQAPVLFEPGSSNQYSNPGMAALAYAVTASLRGTAEPDIRSLLEERFMKPLGIDEAEWSIGYGRGYETDGLNVYANWGGAAFTPRATAKLGLLMLHRGEWNHRQLVSRQWVDKVLAYAGTPIAPEPNDPASGLCWWLNTNNGFEGVPKDAFAGAGANHQLLLVIPSLDLIVVRNGRALDRDGTKGAFWTPVVQNLMQPLLAALTERHAYPPSAVIRSIHFADQKSITRDAIDSDNWPLTWADDGNQYTSYGDGYGFDPKTDKKLSQGFARIEGSPEHLRGINIRSATGERTGGGARGFKASGIVMVDSILYLWVRNAHNAQLAWSADHGSTWQWGFRFESGFGSPAFVNFGRNYAGARDGYVYTYSQDGGSAYEIDDRLLLARVRRGSLRDRNAWEFFERLDERGQPVWTKQLDRRGEVFRYPRHCGRLDAVYNPVLKRYLLALAYNQDGAWGIYDAPEPWGPWSTAFHTEDWGVGHTHGYRLPSKWIDGDHKMTLVFSGLAPYDAFCVRGMTIETQ